MKFHVMSDDTTYGSSLKLT